MSDSISTPAPPADVADPEGSDRHGPVSPPATSQPAISVSEAARLLNQQRHRQDGESRAAPPAQNPRAGSEQSAALPPGSVSHETSAGSELSAMEKALGLTQPVAPPESTPAAPPTEADVLVEIEGQRLRTAEEVREFARRKSADYTQKTQQLAEQARALQAQQASLAQVLPYIQPELAALAARIQDPVRPDPALIHTDPQTYWAQREAYERQVEERDRLAAINQVQQQAQARVMQQQLEKSNAELVAEYPWWGDPAERDKARAQLVEWATTKGGYNHQELANLVDARHLRMMMKAAAYDRLAGGIKTSAPVPPVTGQPRGAPPPPAPSARVEQAYQAFEGNPSIRAGAALLTARRHNGSGQPRG